MKISVVVPVYNVELYLRQCLDSIINQSYSNLEIILVDDGSQDQSLKICEDFASKDSRIKVIHQKNAGVSVARNKGIEAATGEYITFLDSDDWIEKEMYKEMMRITIQHQDVDIVMCDVLNVKNNNTEKITVDIRNGFYSRQDIIKELYPTLIVAENLGRLPIVSTCICLFKKSLLENNKIQFDASIRYSEDYLFMAKVMLHARSFYYLKEVFLYYYRQYNLSRSKKYKPEWWIHLLSLNSKLEEAVIGDKDYDFSRQIKLQLIHSALYVSGAVFQDKNINTKAKLKIIKRLFKDKKLKLSFYKLDFNKYPLGLKIILYLVKHNMAWCYIVYRIIISKIQKLKK